IGGSWDGARGVLKLFFNGKEVKTTKTAPWRIGALGDTFFLGADPNGGNLYQGLIDEFRLCQSVATQSVIPSAKNTRNPKATAWRLLDGDRDDLAAWNGQGAPNWVEIELPEPIELARVIVYPGALRYAPHPSTECSPRRYVIEAWRAGRWHVLSPPVSVPRYTGSGKAHRVVTDVKSTKVSRFRLNITEIYDKGCRRSSPTTPIVPPEECSVVIREIQWQSAQQVADAKRRLAEHQSSWEAEIGWWKRCFDDSSPSPALRVLREMYSQRLVEPWEELSRLSDSDPEALDTFAEHWRHTAKWLDPWKGCVGGVQSTATRQWLDNAVGQIEIEVDPGDTAHEFYPASVALDLRVVEAALGCEVDPYQTQIVEIDEKRNFVPFDPGKTGDKKYLIPSRFDRITPTKGTLSWTLRDRTHTRFAVHFLPKTDKQPPAMGNVTLGNCGRFFYNASDPGRLPGNLWAATVIDWDGDGRQDIIAGRWTDYCHFWKNVGTAAKPVFSEREHWRIIDETETPIVANAKHPGLGFSIPMPVDFDNDGRLDIFMHTYYGEEPTFYRGSGSAAFPIVRCGVKPVGLKKGRLAFGSLDGDETPDVIVVQKLSGKERIVFQSGKGLSADGRPIFGAARTLDLELARSPFAHSRIVPALGDIDQDGDQDLFLYCAPHVWKFENIGTPQAFRFAKGKILERNDKPFEMNYYYPWIAWSDWDADGDLDLIKCTGMSVYLNEGDPATLKLGASVRPTVTRQKTMGRSGLRAQAMVDWDSDGDYDHVVLGSRGLDLRVSLWQDGLFEKAFSVGVDTNRKDWFGCPDPTEYYSLYGNVKMTDWDSDGDLDLFVTSEHSWRFGYIHHYENLGNNTFGPEIELRPRPGHEYVTFVPGRNGQGAQIDQETWVDFLSFRTAGNFEPDAGSIRFWFKPTWSADDGEIHTFFSTTQHPCTYGIGTGDLKHYYIGMKPGLEKRLKPPFAISRTADDKLRFQTWSEQLETEPLNWKAGEWHKIEVTWSTSGRRIVIDG
ncbi:MAG: VCBS repeat-containing protein, partial [Lentisphaeria bacterium]|nr:VCBS repeat-containing protein [Lentisphaeria bacterium]